MPHRSSAYRQQLIQVISTYQLQELLSDRELSLKAGLSPTLVSKIKKGTTIPKFSTLRKLREAGVPIPSLVHIYHM